MSDTKDLINSRFPGWETLEVGTLGAAKPVSWIESDTLGLADMQLALGVSKDHVDELVAASSYRDDEYKYVVMRPKGSRSGLEKRCIISNGKIVAVQG